MDKDSTGLLILTNDGDLINELTHPSVKIPKIYHVTVDGFVTEANINKMAEGFEIEAGKMAYADVQILERTKKATSMEITLYQGLNRQIRKMFDFLGFQVVSLKRIQHATITLEGLKRGEFKTIKPKQIKELKIFLSRSIN